MFRKLCGEETLRNVLLVTTMWGLVDREVGERREVELRTDDILFKPVIDKGARLVRHDNTLQTAQAILRLLIDNHPQPLRIQRELVDEKKDISETGAGEELARELAAVIKKHKEDLAAVQKDMAEALAAKDMETKQELEEVRKELEGSMAKVEQDRDRLSREYAAEKKKADEELGKIRNQLAQEAKEREKRQQELAQLQSEFAHSQQKSQAEQEDLKRRIQWLHDHPPKRRGGLFGFIGDAVDSFLGIF